MYFLRRLQNSRLMQENTDGSGDAGGGKPPATPPAKTDPPAPKTYSAADISAIAKKAADDAVSANNIARDEKEAGLKQNKEDMHAELKALQKKTRETEDAIRMKEGNVAEVTKEIEARVKGEYTETIAEQKKEIANFKIAEHNKSIDAFADELNEMANIKPSARRGRKMEIIADHKIETDENGVMTIDGRNQKEFITDWLENGQYVNDLVLAPQSNGGGALGGKDGAGASGHVKTIGSQEGAAMFAAATKIVSDKK